ncbi:uncharacterized protein LOC112451354 isoform X2 [Kryptolebias marmoratus]|uniref:uncharacterized protein LOC112451354 isoform X2 n=1 Tax=Kryptolebias marmoratus TaxID=37003 RepID=UPI0018AD0137|nr:uncharacterized protein LOC112451354 isoform X2 [Kryptolebias marmoratus]
MEEKKPNTICRFWNWIRRKPDQHSSTGSSSGKQTHDSGTRASRIHSKQKAKRTATARRVEKVWAVQEARNDAVLERVKRSSALTPHEPLISARRRSKIWTLSPVVNEPSLDEEDNRHQRRPESWDREDDSLCKKVHEGSQTFVHACQEAQKPYENKGLTASIKLINTGSSADTDTPNELRAKSQDDNLIEETLVTPVHEDSPVTTAPQETLETPPPECTSVPCPENILVIRQHEDSSGLSTKEITRSLSPQKILSTLAAEEEAAAASLPPAKDPKPERKHSRLPVFSDKVNGAAEKKLVNGIWLQSAKTKVQAVTQMVKKIQFASIPSPRPLNAAKRTSVVTTLAKTSPQTQVSQGKKKGPRVKTLQVSSKPVSKTSKKKTTDSSQRTSKQNKNDLKPLEKPLDSLSLVFELLSSDDWTQKQEGLKVVQGLAQNHPGALKTKLHDVCVVLSEEVKNLWSFVACEAINTLAALYIHLKKAMDPQVERTGRALLLKLAQTTNRFIHQQVNLSLDAMVENCTHGRTVSAMLNTGLNHRCIAVRSSMAQHLHQVAVVNNGVNSILSAGMTITERFLCAAAKMSLDAAPEVRHHGQRVVQELALHPRFLQLWMNIVPERERRPLGKLVKKAKM